LDREAQHRHQLLVVDDDEDIRESLQAVFESEGYEVATACNGREALECLRSHSRLP
jgi:two-component system nitrogen regulation response regulator NtrX